MEIDALESNLFRRYRNKFFKYVFLLASILPGIVYAEACGFNPRTICSTPLMSEWKFSFDHDINQALANINQVYFTPYGCTSTLTLEPEWTPVTTGHIWTTGSFLTRSAVSIPVVVGEIRYAISTGSPLYCDPQYPSGQRYAMTGRTRGLLCPANQSVVQDFTTNIAYCSGTSPCPASTTFNPTAGMCDGVKLTLTSDSNTTEPWNKKLDAEHTLANLSYKATVKDQNGQPKANFDVTITTDVTTGDPSKDGGHLHTSGRPKGKLVAGTVASTKAGKVEVKGKTNASGIFEFTFGAEEASGTHTLTAKCDSGCQAPATATVDVKVEGLEQIPDGASFYTFIGVRAEHDKNHYLTSSAATNILNIAATYHIEARFWKKLKGKKPIPRLPMRLNDASLIWGGLFDIKGKWKPAHEGHRKGIVIDVRANDDTGDTGSIPLPLFDIFKKMALTYYGVDAQVHCTSNKTDGQNRKPPACKGKDGSQDPNRHFHILLLGDDQ